MQCRSHQAVGPFRRRRFDVQDPETLPGLVVEMIGMLVVGQDVFDEPGGERRAVFHGGFPKAEQLPDLGAVILDGAALPSIVRPRGGLDVDLLGDVSHHNIGDLLGMLREASFVLEELQEDGKAEASRAGLVGEQRLLTGQQGPVFGHLVGVPVAFHAAPPLRGSRRPATLLRPAEERLHETGRQHNISQNREKAKFSWPSGGRRVANKVEKRSDCVAPSEKAKSHVVGQIVRLARKERLDYADFLYVCQQARRKLGLRKPKKDRKLPQLLSEADLKRFFRILQECGDLQHEIMLKLLFYTAVRVSELVGIRVEDVDLQQCKIFISRGKGSKDRYILFPRGFRLVLRSHLKANPKNRYLFESQRCTPFTRAGCNKSCKGTATGRASPSTSTPTYSGTRC